jgi:hypothetical protein
MSLRTKQLIKDPFVLVGLVFCVLMFFYRSPDGLDRYLFNQWSVSYSVFLFFWVILYVVLVACRATPRWKITLARCGLILVSCYFGLLLLSGALWIQKRLSFVQGKGHWIRDAELMSKHRPNYHWRGVTTSDVSRSSDDRVISIDLDSEGFRNPDPVPNQIDIAFVGDSFTFASQVNQEELFSTLVAKDLNLIGRNYGINGIGQGTQLEVLKKYVFQKHPKIVVVQLFDNDPADNIFFLGWRSRDKEQSEKENWMVGRAEAATDYPAVGIFTLQLPLKSLETFLFRITERSKGFIVQLPNKSVHFYMPPWPNNYNTPPLQVLPLNFTESIFNYPKSIQDFEAAKQWITAITVALIPSSQFPADEWGNVQLALLKESLMVLATRDLLGEIIAECHQHQCKVVIIRVSTAWQIYRNYMKATPGSPPDMVSFPTSEIPGIHALDKLFGDYTRSKGAVYLSTLDTWEKPSDFYYNRYEPHFNLQGHRAVANTLRPELEKLFSEQDSHPNQKQIPK